jgi:3-phenylpropionate/trans-cinnamate dioxygenase ferredoxin reductase subunit
MDRTEVLIIGGGLAGAVTAEQYRKVGGTGSVALISQEPDRPVHRPPLSKEYLRGDETLDNVFVHSAGFYQDNGIEVRLGRRAVGLDLSGRRVRLEDGDEMEYGALVLATGARPRRLKVPGSDLDGVYYLRSLRSSEHLRRAYEGARHAVIIGAGFIGMEVAATLAQRGVQCTVVEMGPSMWPRLVPEVAARAIQRYCEGRGVSFRFGRTVLSLRGEGQVTGVELDGGELLPADLVVAGVGAVLNTELAESAGLPVDRGILVDQYLRTSHPDVYAVGDIASFPDPIGGRLHLEHWDNALHQGRALGQTLAGSPTPFEHVAYFFSDIFDLSINMIGYPGDWDTQDIRGDLEACRFTAVYGKDDVVRAALMVNDDGRFDGWTEAVRTRQPLEERPGAVV